MQKETELLRSGVIGVRKAAGEESDIDVKLLLGIITEGEESVTGVAGGSLNIGDGARIG